MTSYIGLRNYSDPSASLHVRKGETIEIPDGKVAGHLIGDVIAEYVADETPEAEPEAEPEADIEIDLGADDLAQQPNSKRSSKTGT
jgi:hypothetical protein